MTREHVIELDEESLREIEGRQSFERLLADLNTGFYARATLAEAAMREEKEQIESAPVLPDNVLGKPRMVVNEATFHYWGQRLGYECWDDEQFLREFERDNPDCRINAKSARTTILNPFGQAAREGLKGPQGQKVSTQDSSGAERRTHNPEAGGSNPSPATIIAAA